MKKFSKVVAVLLVMALALPMVFSANSASAAKKKVTAKSIMDKVEKASEDFHNLSVDFDMTVDLGDTLGKMKMTAKGDVQDNPVAGSLDVVMDMSGMKAFVAMVNPNATDDDLIQKMMLYAETTDEGFIGYASADNGANWMKAKLANSMDTENVMGLDTKDIQNAFLKGCKVKETKKAYILSNDFTFTSEMVNDLLKAAEGTANQFEESDIAVIKRMFKKTKKMKISMTIDKKTNLLTSMDCDATAFVNSLFENMANDKDTAAELKPFLAVLKLKDCSFTMKLSNYGKAGKIEIPEEAKASAEQNAREAVENTVDKATGNEDAAADAA